MGYVQTVIQNSSVVKWLPFFQLGKKKKKIVQNPDMYWGLAAD